MTTIYLGVCGPQPAITNALCQGEREKELTTIYMGLQAGSGGPKRQARNDAVLKNPRRPAVLVSYFYIKTWDKMSKDASIREWVLDSGAFSAWNSGKEILLDDYMEECKRRLATDDRLKAVFGLDVIGDHEATIKNIEKMWAEGIEAIPTYHEGEPWDVLLHYAENYPRIALGGIATTRGNWKMEWSEQCFARVWPKKIHGFGYGGEKEIMGLPFHSVDATNWELGPAAFGRWKTFGNMPIHGGNMPLRCEVDVFLDLEERAKAKWWRELANV